MRLISLWFAAFFPTFFFSWAYETFGNDRMIEFVVMATPEDIKANAAYIHLADEFVQVPGGSNNNNYANIRLIADIAERSGAQGVWPGWGHASENDRLPELLAATKTKVVWIGPPPTAMRALGDKIGSTLIAQSAGVPCMDWSGSGLQVAYKSSGLPADLYKQACVSTAAEAAAVCEKIGFPVMIKASEGGGGKGIRKVETTDEVAMAFNQVTGEVPGSPIFIMKLAPNSCRHLEVQLLADRNHDALAVFGRDCSIQRRHQKIIEEGPVVAAPPEIWRKMEQSAVMLAKEVGYVGAGTVEYLYMEDGSFAFLELNPRLQVEHPVTELISGVNLPAAQLQIAMGIPLHNIRGVRRMFGEHPDTDTPIDFYNRQAKTLPGHVIACRITAENPDSSFQPTSGVIQELNFRSTPDVWGYFSVAARGGIHEYSDSQFGHLFALGETREIARRNMVLAIKELSIRGDIRTTVEYLQQILETEDFRSNNLSTTWLERLMSKRAVITEKPPLYQTILLGGLWRTYKLQQKRNAEYMAMLERGQLPSPSMHHDLISNSQDLIYDRTKYRLAIEKTSERTYDILLNGASSSIEIHILADDGLLCILNGKKHVIYGQEFPSGLRLVIDGKTVLFHEEYDPTQLRTSMPGKLVRYLLPDGAHIQQNKPYAEIEVMKMYITLNSPEDGFVKLLKPEGSIIEAGDLLATLNLDHPERVQKAELFTGVFPEMTRLTGGPANAAMTPVQSQTQSSNEYVNNHVNLTLKESLRALQNLLAGWSVSPDAVKRSVDDLMNSLRAPILPLEQFREALATVTSRLPSSLVGSLTAILDAYASDIRNHRFAWESPSEFPVLDLQNVIDQTLVNPALTEEDKNKLLASLNGSGMTQLLQTYKLGNHGYAVAVLTGLWDQYFTVEEKFCQSIDSEKQTPEFVIKQLRKQHKEDLDSVARIARAHHQLAKRNELIVLLLDIIQRQLSPLLPDFLPTIKRLSQLSTRDCGTVVLKARQLIMATELPSNAQRKIAIQTILQAASTSNSSDQRRERLAPLIDQSQPIEDMIFQFMDHKRTQIQTTAMEAYIRRIYQVYSVPYLECQALKSVAKAVGVASDDGPALIAKWHFLLESTEQKALKLANALTPTPSSSSPTPTSATCSWPQTSVTTPPSATMKTTSPTLSTKPLSSVSSIKPVSIGASSKPHHMSTTSHLMQKSDSVSDLGKLRSKAPRSTTVAGQPTAMEEESDEEDESGKTLPSGSSASSTQGTTTPATGARSSRGFTSSNVRQGVLGYFASFDAMKRGFNTLLPLFDTSVKFVEPIHVLYVALKWGSGTSVAGQARLPSDDTLSTYLRTFLAGQESAMMTAGIRRVTFIVTAAGEKEEYPAYFTYRSRLSYEEDTLVRHIEPITAAQLDLERLSNFDLRHLSTTNRMLSLFAAYPAKVEGKGVALHDAEVPPSNPTPASASTTAYDGRRFFVRTLVRKLDGASLFGQGSGSSASSSSLAAAVESDLDAYPETEFAFVEALNALEIAMGDTGSAVSPFKFNSIFLNVLVEAAIDVKYIEAVIRLMARRYATKVKRLYVAVVELNINIISDNGHGNGEEATCTAYRFIATNPTGYNLLVDTYIERKDEATGKIYFKLVNKNDQHGRSMVYSDCSTMTDAIACSPSWDGLEVSSPYPVSIPFQRQRQVAASMETVYVYDFLPLLEHALSKIWKQRYQVLRYAAATAGRRKPSVASGSLFHQLAEQIASTSGADTFPSTLPERESAYAELKSDKEAELSNFIPPVLLKAVELVLSKDSQGRPTLEEKIRPPGQANIGMVAWLLTLYTPELSSSRTLTPSATNKIEAGCRQVVLIANDITFQAGTFGPQEDLLFDLASKFARVRGLPRWYFSANSGARIGLAEELRNKFQIQWQDDNPLKGFAYLYLSEADHALLHASVKSEKITVNLAADASANLPARTETRYVIKDIIGARDGLGVENLRGSGTIAGETSRAYEDIYTLTYVTSRTVGIGAYLARLGQRVIQKNSLPIILTGYSALNKLLGKQVYTSNVQLGGPDIMFTNGVSHLTVDDDMEGVTACLNWLSYVPVKRHAPVPMLMPAFADSVARKIDFVPTKSPYDPRHMLAGCKVVDPETNASVWQSGLLDRDSWTELLGGWARTAIVGRGRIGGMPLALIAVETRTVEQIVPADPASPDTKEQIHQRAGQVWFPDSAYKTAQGIRDAIAEDLPLLILANWRGFSGGQKDMFEEVLKFGAYIVDSLRDYEQPVIVYLPPHATLRGGAWVVVDQTINEQYMEMYADESARGGVLETEGTLDVKYRKKDVLATAHRLDAKLIALDAELKSLESGDSTAASTRGRDVILKEIRAREALIFPTYHQVATQFADLHDTPGRMEAKGCIQGSVPWEQAREFFYWRFQRKMIEANYVKRMVAVVKECSPSTLNVTAVEPWRASQQLLDEWIAKGMGMTVAQAVKANQAAHKWLVENQSTVESHFNQWKNSKIVDRMKALMSDNTSSDSSSSLSGDDTVGGLTTIIQSLTPEQKAALKKIFA